jgi:hypothetical protein
MRAAAMLLIAASLQAAWAHSPGSLHHFSRLSAESIHPPADIYISCDADEPLEGAQAELEPVSAATTTGDKGRWSTVMTEHVTVSGDKRQYFYKALFNGLSAGSSYRWRCGDATGWTSWQSFAAIAEIESYPPSIRPDRVILTWQGDTATTQSVTWRTSAEVKHPIAQFAPSASGAGFVANARSVEAATHPLETREHGRVLHHTVHFVGLTPETRYSYRVGERGGQWSEWFQFRTASREAKPFSFIYFGDAQHMIRDYFSQLIRQAALDAPQARFIVHAGDLVNTGSMDLEWGEWFGAGSWLNAMIPSMPVVGNHEYYRTRGPDNSYGPDPLLLTPHWRAQFALPEHGPKEMAEDVYYFDFQGVRMIALNSVTAENKGAKNSIDTRAVEAQARWLEDVLRDNPNRWAIVSFHYPVFSSWPAAPPGTPWETGSPKIMKYWKPVFDRYGVDMVLQGHEHTYARVRVGVDSPVVTNQITGGSRYFDAKSGAVYVTSVASAIPLKVEQQMRIDMVRTGENLQLYQVITVDRDTLRFEAKTVDGSVYDAFDLIDQGRGKPNRLVAREPQMSPHYFPDEITIPASGGLRLTAAEMDRYVGTYQTDGKVYFHRVVEIKREGDGLVICAPGDPDLKLIAASPTEFVTEPRRTSYWFVPDPAGVRFKLGEKGEARWMQFAGQYYERLPKKP